jgi:hypothetical protein
MIIPFIVQTSVGPFSDALNLPDDHEFSPEEIENMKQQRASKWETFMIEARNRVYEVIEEPAVQESVVQDPPVEDPPVDTEPGAAGEI